MSAATFLALGETDRRLELVDGVVVMSPSPQPKHQRVALFIVEQLLSSVRRLPGAELYYETDVALAPLLVYQPDVMIFAPGVLPRNPRSIDLPPDLAIEILSPDNRRHDLVTKREDYEKFGVGEYWIVDADTLQVLVLQRTSPGGAYVEQPESDTIECRSIPGVRLDVSVLRAGLA
jgi:Uma2 family endonuclease